MIVLGIDTSGYANAVGVVTDGRILADVAFEARTDSLEKIVVNIDDVLRSAGRTLGDIDGIGVGLGPGSWTGIRVGVTVGKILAFSAGKKVAGISTLEALAYGARDESASVCAVIGTGAGNAVYAACYRVRDGELTLDGDYYVGPAAGLAETVTDTTVLVGSWAAAYAKEIEREMNNARVHIVAMEAAPGGAAIALLAERRLERGDSDDALSLTPLYLKESTAKALVQQRAEKKKTWGKG